MRAVVAGLVVLVAAAPAAAADYPPGPVTLMEPLAAAAFAQFIRADSGEMAADRRGVRRIGGLTRPRPRSGHSRA